MNYIYGFIYFLAVLRIVTIEALITCDPVQVICRFPALVVSTWEHVYNSSTGDNRP